MIGPRLSRELVVSRAQFLFHDSGLRPGPRLERVLRSRHTLGEAGVGRQAPGLAGKRCPRRREQAVERCPAGRTVLSPGAGKEALQGEPASSLRSPALCTQLCLCRSQADAGVRFPSGWNPQTHPLYAVQFREGNFFPFLGAGCCCPCREKVKLSSEPGL